MGVQEIQYDDTHQHLHEQIEKALNKDSAAMKEALTAAITAHNREHELNRIAHEREHELNDKALNKAEQSMDKRLEGMNEFREQLNSQTATFVNRETFERYTKESDVKIDAALLALTDKWDTISKSLVNRHDSDFNSLAGEIQAEREIRKSFEGSVNTWKWLASFLGASGVAGVIYLFINTST